jgi:hypothetical protein
VIDDEMIESVTRAYLTAGLWADAMHDDGEPCERAHIDFTPDDIQEGRDRAEEIVTDFLGMASEDSEAWAIVESNPEQAGHDLWLTANRHGAGFWDRGYGPAGDRLTDMAHSMGGAYILIGSDGPEYVES